MYKNTTDININSSEDLNNNYLKKKNNKTTNINILLNRVKAEKRIEIKKKIIFLSLLILLVTFITILSII